MKNSTYNTGRKVTISLDNLGNAALWQIYQILTDGTGNAFYGNEEEASPAADPDAACEVFLHAAETANDRAAGADAAQRAWLQEMVAEYTEIFETNPADDLRKRLERHAADANEEPEKERDAYTLPADDDRAEQIEQIILRRGLDVNLICNTNAGGYTYNVTLLGDTDDIETLLEEITEEGPTADDADDDAPENKTDAYDAVWHYLGRPEGEFLKEILAEISLDVKQDSTNLFKAGQFEGTARMLAAAIVNDGADGGEGVAAITRAVYDYCGIGW